MNHNYTKGMMVGLAIGFMILPLVFVGLRLWAKRLAKRIGWDDYLTIAALVRYLKAKCESKHTNSQLARLSNLLYIAVD